MTSHRKRAKRQAYDVFFLGVASLLLMAVGRGGISTSVGDSTQVLPIFHGRYSEMLLDETAKERKVWKFQTVTDFFYGECGAFKIVGDVGKRVFAYPFVRRLATFPTADS